MNQIERLVKIYLDSRERILKEIAKRELWARKADYQQQLLREIDRELKRLNLETFAWADEAIEAAYTKSAKLAWMAAQEADKGVKAFSAFGGVHKKAVELLAHNAQDYLGITNSLIARQAKDTVRKIGVEVTGKKFAETLTVRETRKLLEQRLAEENFYTVPWRNGRGSMRVDSYAALVARTTTREATMTGTFNQAEALGHHLYKMTSHNTTCKVCASRQGRVYRSVDFPSGDPRQAFPHISEGFPRWPTYKTVHPNCSHSAHVFIWDQKTQAEQQTALEGAAEPFNYDPRGEVERKRYEDAQRKNAERLRDRKQWEQYNRVLGKEHVPKTFSGFRSMKKAGGDNYGILKAKYKAMGYYNRALSNEPIVTGIVRGTAKTADMTPLGLEYRTKSKESYLSKVVINYSPDGNEYEIKDILRYTLSAGPHELSDKTLIAIAELGRKGYNTNEVKNTWLNPMNPYKGVNTIVTSPNGQKFEVQYHTPESFRVKDGEMHKLYEQWRVLPTGDPAKKRLETAMRSLSDGLTRPDDIEKVK